MLLHLNYADMRWRRIVYGLVTVGAFVFHLFNGEWLSWILLVGLLCLPWLSLLLSLPSIALTKMDLSCPAHIPMNTAVFVKPRTTCPLPLPPIKWKFLAHESFSGKKLTFVGNDPFLADHCGAITVSLKQFYVYDYMGLFRFPKGKKEKQTLLVLPEPVPVANLPSLKKYLAANWKPKPGGGFSENYDLREYRPGDDLRQIHWKLAAKTGKVILREPTIPIRGKLVLSMSIKGTPEDLDRKFGQLVYLADHFLSMDLNFVIACGTGTEVRTFSIKSEQDFRDALFTMLQLPLTESDFIPVTNASWHYRIGGEQDEA